jgi:hypothetical protein
MGKANSVAVDPIARTNKLIPTYRASVRCNIAVANFAAFS